MFKHLRLKNLCHLVSVLSHTDLEMLTLIKNRYGYQGTHYDETFAFLEGITGIKETGTGIQVNSVFRDLADNIDEKSIANKALLLIQANKGPYQDELFQYILKFGLVDGELTYQPADLDRSKFSDIRNFLIETGIVEYRSGTGIYLIPPDQIQLYALARQSLKVVSPGTLKRRLADKDKIGREAELAILKYEKDRVGVHYEDQVIHIALKNEAAGYDITSVSLMEGNQIEHRYIEVKAVPIDTYRFFWSSNERMVAELMKSLYYIYLLPVNPGNGFSLDKLKIIKDPIAGILNSPDTWNIETDIVRCSLIPTN